MSNRYLIIAAAGLFAAASVAAQDAAAPFDGRWAIVAAANDGRCDKIYRLPIDVKDGAIRYSGSFAVDADGRIDSTGRLTMTLAHRGDVVRAQGRVGAQLGKGKWQSPGCAGVWKARRSVLPTSSK